MVVLGIAHTESEQDVKGCRTLSSGVQEGICHQVHLHDTESSGPERASEGKSAVCCGLERERRRVWV